MDGGNVQTLAATFPLLTVDYVACNEAAITYVQL